MRRLLASVLPLVVMAALSSAAMSVPGPVSGQVAFAGPPLIGPASPHGLAVFLADLAPGDGLGALATWRHARGSIEVGYRASIGEGADGDLALGGGVDLSGVLTSGVEDADVDVLWWAGIGAGVGEDVIASVPVGIVVGWSGEGDSVVFSPYLGGHVALDFTSSEGDAVSLDASFDLGIDLDLVSGWVVRFGMSLGGRDALAIGISVPRGSSSSSN